MHRCVLTSVRQLTGIAKFNNGSVAEDDINLKFDVADENDNPPVFAAVPPASVTESSPAGRTSIFSQQHSQCMFRMLNHLPKTYKREH